MTTDDQKLTEQIRDEVVGIVIGSGHYSTAVGIDEAEEVAAAVLPIIRKAQAEAWDGATLEACAAACGCLRGRDVPNPYREEQING